MITQQLGLFGEIPNDGKRLRAENGASSTRSRHSNQNQQIVAEVSQLNGRIQELEQTIAELRDLLFSQKTVKESYDTKEVAQILGRKPYTVREWCRLQRINAYKAMCGRGCEEEWRIKHDELVRIQNEGLLPVPERY